MTLPGGPYLLYIEDDIEDVELLQHVLQHADLSVGIINMSDGVRALDFLEHAKAVSRLPDMILLDINMSKLDGRETFVCIKADKLLARIPIAILSTSNLGTDISYFKKYQVPYIVKPGDINRFKDEIANLVKRVVGF